MQTGLILQYVSLILVPAWILYDSKKRRGQYSWIIALLVTLGLAMLVRQTLFDLKTKWMAEMLASDPGIANMIIWGKTILAYLIPIVVYKTILRRPNGRAAPQQDEPKES